ncbi:hypothetical protein [Moheibacter lacus]|uniref:Uncharacterized protein n=1 Tax=Moheibacter lacus TaxID=2745851 RepID=A0A838ZLD3_9FLAO|nr:hypothetical protein [Moheibacter lacus]MBA5628550.1 hypothetical protein [Moheibacter lacus]
MNYTNHERNHAILPGREQELFEFLNASIVCNGKAEQHKLKYANNSNSEDALTWSCFDRLRNLPKEKIEVALEEIFEDAFGDFKEINQPVPVPFSFADEQSIEISIGKNFTAKSVKESTEVDICIETNDKLVFFEAKLYSKISEANEKHKHDQIARKLHIGIDVANASNREFYFIFLDIAPCKEILKYGEKKQMNARRFLYYRNHPENLVKQLKGVPFSQIEEISKNMGWLTWASLYKTLLRVI